MSVNAGLERTLHNWVSQVGSHTRWTEKLHYSLKVTEQVHCRAEFGKEGKLAPKSTPLITDKAQPEATRRDPSD